MKGFPRQYAYRMRIADCKNDQQNALYPVAHVHYTDTYPSFEDRYYADARDAKIKFFHSNNVTSGFNIDIYSPSTCLLTVEIGIDIPETLSQIVRFNQSALFASMIAIMLFACAHQVSTNFKDGVLSSIFSVLFSRVGPVMFIVLPLLSTYMPISAIPQIVTDSPIFSTYGAPPSLHQDDCWYILLVGLFAYACVVLLAIALHVITLVLSLPMSLVFNVINLMKLRYVGFLYQVQTL